MLAASFLTVLTAQADIVSFTGTVYNDSGNLLNASSADSGTAIGGFSGSAIHFEINDPQGSNTPMSSFFTGVTTDATLESSVWWNRVMSDPSNAFGNGIYSTGVIIDGTASFNAGDEITITHDDGAILTLEGLGAVINSGSPTSALGSTYTFANDFNGTFNLKYMATNGNPEDLNFTAKLAPAPEPSSIALFGAGLIGFAGIIRKKHASR